MSGSIDNLGKITPSRKSRCAERSQFSATANQSTPGSLNDRVVIDKQGLTVARTVKTKGHKTTPKMPKTPSTNPESENQFERKKRSSVLTENKSNWPGTFREQTKASLKQSLHQMNGGPRGSKTARPLAGDYREPRRVRRDAPSVNPSATSVASRESTESVIVIDKGVQCGGLFDSSNNHFNLLNPIPTIAFLMKELESLVKDEKSSAILYQMEQALLRIPKDTGKSSPDDLEMILKYTQLEASVTQLAAAGKEMQTTLEASRKEKAILQQQLEEKSLHLESSLRREAELEAILKDLRQKLTDSSKLDLTNKKLLSDLKEKNEKIQLLQNITTELKTELNEQTELAQQRFLDSQFLKMEKEKLSVMSSFKDSQLIEHRKAMKNLQHLIGDQLINITKTSRPENLTLNADGYVSHMMSGGRVSSSPVRSSNNSVIVMRNVGHDVVDVSEPSISTIDVTSPPTMINKNLSSQLETLINESGNQTEKFKEKTHLEFTSIGGDDGSHIGSILKPSEDEFIYVVPEGIRDGNCDEVEQGESEVKRSRGRLSLDGRVDWSKGIKEIEMMYQNTRINSKVEVRVPSPPRNYPHPDWSDSSLPTMSISESNLV
ncbi:uncharacterized protein LOC107043166 [Diachasma alloeum]|uniref:uncharacterized protein LOC107043166 n=1 Tax=Diachasma alloeum TaxID=454923 RepID=UPI0007381664|nr:uncharacterized protein LOC107043166 [Diachasma alloeum]